MPEERLLVAYRRGAAGKVATLDVSLADAPESEELAVLVKGHGAATGWKLAGPIESLEIGGRPAARGAYQTRGPAPGEIKEIVVVRNGGRVYYFTGIFASDDEKSREQARKAVETLSW
jgi:hypothetical protein